MKTSEHASEYMAKLIMRMTSAMQNNNKREITLLRREIRRKLFQIRNKITNNDVFDDNEKSLKKWFELQFHSGMSWFSKGQNNEIVGGFTWTWDISAQEPLKLIIPLEWDGNFDDGHDPNGMKMRLCVPPAFTRQG